MVEIHNAESFKFEISEQERLGVFCYCEWVMVDLLHVLDYVRLQEFRRVMEVEIPLCLDLAMLVASLQDVFACVADHGTIFFRRSTDDHHIRLASPMRNDVIPSDQFLRWNGLIQINPARL